MLDPFADAQTLSEYTKGAISINDPRVEGALAGASAAIRRYCGWHVAPVVTETLTLDGPGGRVLSLPTLNVSAVGPVVEDTTSLTDSTDYRWSADGSVKRKSGYWSDDYRILTVTLTHGYFLQDVPDVVRVILAVVARELSSPTGATREQAGAVSVSWAISSPGVSGGIALLQHERDVLDHYRIEGA